MSLPIFFRRVSYRTLYALSLFAHSRRERRHAVTSVCTSPLLYTSAAPRRPTPITCSPTQAARFPRSKIAPESITQAPTQRWRTTARRSARRGVLAIGSVRRSRALTRRQGPRASCSQYYFSQTQMSQMRRILRSSLTWVRVRVRMRVRLGGRCGVWASRCGCGARARCVDGVSYGPSCGLSV